MKNRISLFSLILTLFLTNLINTFAQRTVESDKANIKAAYAALERRDYNAFASLCADDYAELGIAPTPIKGVWAAIEQYKAFLLAFPDIKFNIESIVPAGPNSYYLKVTVTGTNTAPFMMLPATGKSIRVSDMDIIELNAAGKCISHWSANGGGALNQIGYGSLNNPNTGVVMAAYGAFGKGDIPGVLAHCSDNVTWDVSDIPSPGMEKKVYTGKPAVEQFFTQLGSKVHFNKFEPWRFIADGDDVVVLINAELKSLVDNKTYTTTAVHHLTVKNGKVTSFKETATPAKPM